MEIPFAQYLNIRKAYGPSFSPDGKRLAFITNITGIPQAWVVNSEGGWPDQITFHSERVSQVSFSPTSNQLVFSRDIGGNENAQLFLVNADGSAERRFMPVRTLIDGLAEISSICKIFHEVGYFVAQYLLRLLINSWSLTFHRLRLVSLPGYPTNRTWSKLLQHWTQD